MGGISEINKKLVVQLRQELRIVYLIYHRNKNQHGATVWWKQLNILKRNVAQAVRIIEGLVFRGVCHDKQLLKLHSLLYSILKLQIKKMYYDFNGVISLGQFVTLGVVLIGNLARIYTVYMHIYDTLEEDFRRIGCIKNNTSSVNPGMSDNEVREALESIADEEIGEEIGEDLETMAIFKSTDDHSKVLAASGKKDNKYGKKKKQKKKKSAIDDLFG